MATTTYTIIFQNNHGEDGDYAVFSAPPKVSSSSTAPAVYTNAWITQFVPNTGNTTISTSADYYAWAGIAPQSPAPGVVISSGIAQLVQLGQDGDPPIPGTTLQLKVSEATGSVSWGASVPWTSDPAAYEIDTGSDFNEPNSTILVGMAKTDAHGILSPVASSLASNNSATQITPVVEFYLGQFSYVPGEIVDIQTVSKQCANINFSSGVGAGNTVATVTQASTGLFSVKYFPTSALPAINAALSTGTLNSWLASQSSGSNGDLERQLEAKEEVLQLLQLGDGLWAYTGIVTWPAVAAVGIITAGVAAITGYLIKKNYSATYTQKRNADGTTTVSVAFNPPPSTPTTVPVNVVNDWIAAVNADTQNDGHLDLGLIDNTQLIALSTPAQAANGNLLQAANRVQAVQA